MKDFELAVSELLDQYRNKIPLGQAAAAMQAQLKLLVEDQSWYAEPPEEPAPDEEPPAAA